MPKFSTAMLLALGMSGPALAAELHCTTAQICAGGADCAAAPSDALQLRLQNWDQPAPILSRDGVAFAVSQTKTAPIWRWNGTAPTGEIHVLAWREADGDFTYLVLEAGQTALKATGSCEVR